ncbi:ABC transporter permease [Paenibacillus apiarius]|uniref:ABC transporter permease n=1 Tax=Paenibacillus apiarius TaxID=46240 RepID=A0ABT4DMW0_9BACL|nr:ABC transporter permease [Paenibacillus apiarius]MCY9514679.1 ABC transporter permease [Paenibacillus apiarius]MCY9518669.1 ABC transporter permease [Paenibacillus apiarius]MCY9552890.1 ABC transporter permease [Paenibacillus apiarius]MCY9556915.1 ABC transporter permease [Paenibacillus apiarius]MCY9686132.1 ABC transporter permease [Paenibacillus apiarius]
MIRYTLVKLFYLVVSLWILASVTFLLMKAIPGDPFMSERAVPPEIKARLMAQYGLDKPLHEQYFIYLNKLVHGDLGISMKMQDREVVQMIRDSFPYSLRLGIVAIIVSVVVGVSLGMLAALRHRKLLDTSSMVLAVIGVSVPSFVLASFFQYLFGVKLKWFAVVGLNAPLDYVLPTIALSALPIAFIARLTRSNMLEVLHSDYIKTARSKGLTAGVIVRRHVLRNGILPVVTYIGPLTANVVTGSFIIEQIFGIGGLGKVFVISISNRDYSLIMGITIFYGLILMSARFLTDLAYGFIDPRIKLGNGKEKAA